MYPTTDESIFDSGPRGANSDQHSESSYDLPSYFLNICGILSNIMLDKKKN